MMIIDGPGKQVPQPTISEATALDIEALTPQELTAYLIELRSKKNAEINQERLAANYAYFNYLGKKIACDSLSRSDIESTNGLVLLLNALPPGFPGGWKTKDNSYVPITTLQAWRGFYIAMYQQGVLNFTHSQNLKVLLNNATTVEAINAIKWSIPTI